MFGKNFKFKNFKKTRIDLKVKKNFKSLLKENNQVLGSLKSSYRNNYDIKKILKLKKNLRIRIIGMGGSILGAKAIYNFLSVKKKIFFIDNLSTKFNFTKDNY